MQLQWSSESPLDPIASLIHLLFSPGLDLGDAVQVLACKQSDVMFGCVYFQLCWLYGVQQLIWKPLKTPCKSSVCYYTGDRGLRLKTQWFPPRTIY